MTTSPLIATASLLLFAWQVSAQTRGPGPATAALNDCATLVGSGAVLEALERCEQAALLNPTSGVAHLLLAAVHESLAAQAPELASAPNPQKLLHRSRAIEHYRKGLTLTGRAAGDLPRRRPALSALVGLYASSGETGKVVVAYADELARETPLDIDNALSVARVYANNGRFEDGISILEKSAAGSPNQPFGYHSAATFLWDKASRDPALSENAKLNYVERALGYEDRALAIDSDFIDALTFKGLLLRLKASLTRDAAKRSRLVDEANALQARSMQLMKARVPPPTGAADPVRVGGEIKPPAKLKHVPPVYPAMAISARITGEVIIEATIGTDGTVIDSKVLQSVQHLDAAALDAVKQWVFAPTYLNGVAVPVIMTVTVNFSLK